MGEILNTFALSITERAEEGGDAGGDNNNDNNKSKGGVEAEDEKIMKTGKQSRPLPRRWPPSQTISTTSWTSSRPLQSSHHKSPQCHSLFMRKSAHESVYVAG